MNIQELCIQVQNLKSEFSKTYSGNSHIQEILPKTTTDFKISNNDLTRLHEFASKNPIYHNQYDKEISKKTCVVYEGDINNFWIGSIKHATSYQPFYPTWILSAYLLSMAAKEQGFERIVDIGSGDGRIAYCAKILGVDTLSIEIDQDLVDLQTMLVRKTGVDFNPICHDATTFEYSIVPKTVFFIGGLPQMGDMLASGVIEKTILPNPGYVFAGTYSKKQFIKDSKYGGWDSTISKNNLKVKEVLELPTIWTFDQERDTPYVFTISE